MSQQVDHGGGDDAVHVQDQVGLLASGDRLHVQRVPRDGARGPARAHVGLQFADARIRVVDGFYSVLIKRNVIYYYQWIVRASNGHVSMRYDVDL